jgi:hypothetical protein
MTNWALVATIIRLVRALLKDMLKTDGRDSFQFQGNPNFTLSEDYPDSASVKVYKNGILMSTGYSYNATTKIVTITAILATNDIILITYWYYDKYSDTEICNWIEASFCYFSQFGYRKVFKLSDDRTEVLTINGVNPCVRECYEIAIIASICIDPENIDIRTKDFSVSATNKESKNELIQKALMQFTVWYGDFEFQEGRLFNNLSLDEYGNGYPYNFFHCLYYYPRYC